MSRVPDFDFELTVSFASITFRQIAAGAFSRPPNHVPQGPYTCGSALPVCRDRSLLTVAIPEHATPSLGVAGSILLSSVVYSNSKSTMSRLA
jgi:hypothetical protein